MIFNRARLLFIPLVCLMAACSKPVITQSLWQNEKLKVKVNEEAWNDSLQFDGKSRMFYSLRNDNENLYISVRAIDDETQNKIMMLGMTIWIDTTGKGKKAMGIHYPLGLLNGNREEAKRYIPEHRRMSMAAKMGMKNELLKHMIEMELPGFGLNGKQTIQTDDAHVNVSMSLDSQGFMNYNAVIPYKAMHFSGRLQKTGKQEPLLSFGIETGKIEKEKSNDMPAERLSNATPGGASMPGGGGGTGMPGSMGSMGRGAGSMARGNRGGGNGSGYIDEDADNPDPVDLWMKVRLGKR